MKKFLALLVAAMMSISVLAACGTKTEEVEDNTAVEETVEEAAEEAAEEETEEAEGEEAEEAEAEEKAE